MGKLLDYGGEFDELVDKHKSLYAYAKRTVEFSMWDLIDIFDFRLIIRNSYYDKEIKKIKHLPDGLRNPAIIGATLGNQGEENPLLYDKMKSDYILYKASLN